MTEDSGSAGSSDSGGGSSDSGSSASDTGSSGSEPTSGSYEAPPIEQFQSSPEQPQTESPTQAQSNPYEPPGYVPPPAYGGAPIPDPPAYPPHPGYQVPPGYQPASGYPPPSDFGAPPGYPPPPPYTDPSSFGAPPYPPPPPGYGPPPAGYPAAGYGGFGPPAQQTNTLAIASLVASVFGLCCGIGSIAGIVLGIIAMNQIKEKGEGGQGLAIAGIAVGALTFLISLVWTIGVMSS